MNKYKFYWWSLAIIILTLAVMSGQSPAVRATIDAPLLGPNDPYNLQPTNKTYPFGQPVTMTWEVGAKAAYCVVTVEQYPNQVKSGPITVKSFTLNAPTKGSHHWEVVCYDNQGGPLGVPQGLFHVETKTYPDMPVNLHPANVSVPWGQPVTLTWTADATVVNCHLEMFPPDGNIVRSGRITARSYSVGTLSVSGTYYWIVECFDAQDAYSGWTMATFEVGLSEPVIFIAGMASSVLAESANGSVRWVDIVRSKMILALPDPNHSIIATDVIRNAVGPFRDVYGSLIDRMTQEGYVEYKEGSQPHTVCIPGLTEVGNFYTFAWDWRYGVKSVSDPSLNPEVDQAVALKNYLDCVITQHRGKKINIVAHSMGGLYALLAVLKDNTLPINHIITMGTPWLGAPKAIAMMINGDFNATAISKNEVQALLEHFPGAHQLLPSEAYFNIANSPYSQYLQPFRIFDSNYNLKTVQYSDFTSVLQGTYPIHSTVSFTKYNDVVYKTPGFTDWQLGNTGIQYDVIYGQQHTPSTIEQVYQDYHDIPACNNYNDPACHKIVKYFDVRVGDGDGTVALLSTEWPIHTQHSANVHMYKFVEPQNFTQSVAHDKLPRNKFVQDCVLHILLPMSTYTCTNESGKSVSAASTLSDSEPRHLMIWGTTGITVSSKLTVSVNLFTSEPFPTEYPGLGVNHTGSDAVHLVYPSDAGYEFEVIPSANGILIETTLGRQESPVQVDRYTDLEAIPDRTYRFIPNGDTSIIAQDLDHDGRFDKVIHPSVILTGTAVTDSQPPTVTIVLDAKAQVAVIEVSDDLSGVYRVYYSTNVSRTG